MKFFANKTYRMITIALIVLFSIVFGAVPCAASTNESYYASIANKINEFINNPNWSDGATWGYYKEPIDSTYSSIGCCAYVADFAKYVYGTNDLYNGDSRYYDINDIQAGDVVYMRNYDDSSGHWFAVLKRDGNTLTCAEGNWAGGMVVIGKTRTINASAGRFDEDNIRYFRYGIRYIDFSRDVETPAKPEGVTGVTISKTTKNSIKLKWKKVSGSNIEYKIFANGECVGTTEKTSFKHSGLTPQTAYTYQIVACTSYYDKDLCVHAIDGSLAKGETVVGITNK